MAQAICINNSFQTSSIEARTISAKSSQSLSIGDSVVFSPSSSMGLNLGEEYNNPICISDIEIGNGLLCARVQETSNSVFQLSFGIINRSGTSISGSKTVDTYRRVDDETVEIPVMGYGFCKIDSTRALFAVSGYTLYSETMHVYLITFNRSSIVSFKDFDTGVSMSSFYTPSISKFSNTEFFCHCYGSAFMITFNSSFSTMSVTTLTPPDDVDYRGGFICAASRTEIYWSANYEYKLYRLQISGNQLVKNGEVDMTDEFSSGTLNGQGYVKDSSTILFNMYDPDITCLYEVSRSNSSIQNRVIRSGFYFLFLDEDGNGVQADFQTGSYVIISNFSGISLCSGPTADNTYDVRLHDFILYSQINNGRYDYVKRTTCNMVKETTNDINPRDGVVSSIENGDYVISLI